MIPEPSEDDVGTIFVVVFSGIAFVLGVTLLEAWWLWYTALPC